jgi:hypothetical protein
VYRVIFLYQIDRKSLKYYKETGILQHRQLTNSAVNQYSLINELNQYFEQRLETSIGLGGWSLGRLLFLFVKN